MMNSKATSLTPVDCGWTGLVDGTGKRRLEDEGIMFPRLARINNKKDQKLRDKRRATNGRFRRPSISRMK